jgi:uncharacterized 2Fe-2S/4Fe-4S cluster protein (DUF4445 family)
MSAVIIHRLLLMKRAKSSKCSLYKRVAARLVALAAANAMGNLYFIKESCQETSAMPDHMIHFQPIGRKVEATRGRTLLELATEAGISMESICGSEGKCGKCRVILRSGIENVTPLNSNEKRVLDKVEQASGMRLACQASVCREGALVVEIPQESQRGHQRLLAAGTERNVKLEPAVRKIVLKIPPATLKDLRADDDRLIEFLRRKIRSRLKISEGVHRYLPAALREMAWVTTVTAFRNEEIIRVEPGDTADELFGVAVDIGTTKVVAYLVDLNTGKLLATESMPNPQIPFGEDVIARITYCNRNKEGLQTLQRVIAAGVDMLIAKLCTTVKLEPDDMLEVMVVGNTAMHHLFFGISAQHLAEAPYAPVVRTPLVVNPGHVGLSTYPFGKVSSLPNIAGFVGADAVADLIASGLYGDDDVGMMIDIGTNTEIIAGSKDRLISCSCASGPAFEGAHIRFGMRASSGAIERVWIDPETMEVVVRTVDDAPARGICGSGIVDALSEMLAAGLIDASGKIKTSAGLPGIRKNHEGLPEFVLVSRGNSSTGEPITITQHDIQEIQLAKAAIFTGVATLMRKLKVRPSDISKVYAAGAFGTYVDASSAIRIGMYPDVPIERIEFIGNAAGSGARMCLRSMKMRDIAERQSRKVEYIELAAEKDFQKEFAQAMFLPHRDLSRFPNARR